MHAGDMGESKPDSLHNQHTPGRGASRPLREDTQVRLFSLCVLFVVFLSSCLCDSWMYVCMYNCINVCMILTGLLLRVGPLARDISEGGQTEFWYGCPAQLQTCARTLVHPQKNIGRNRGSYRPCA